MSEAIIPDRLYTEEETRQHLGNIGKTKMYEYRHMMLITPFRTRPLMYLGSEIIEALGRINDYVRTRYEVRR